MELPLRTELTNIDSQAEVMNHYTLRNTWNECICDGKDKIHCVSEWVRKMIRDKEREREGKWWEKKEKEKKTCFSAD